MYLTNTAINKIDIDTMIKNYERLTRNTTPAHYRLHAVRAELWCTSFGDPGDDYCEVRLFDLSRQFATCTIPGF